MKHGMCHPYAKDAACSHRKPPQGRCREFESTQGTFSRGAEIDTESESTRREENGEMFSRKKTQTRPAPRSGEAQVGRRRPSLIYMFVSPALGIGRKGAGESSAQILFGMQKIRVIPLFWPVIWSPSGL